MKHLHHIVPKHAGGTDDSTNLVELTVEEHAEAHRLLWEQYGRWQDKIAWKTLSGQISIQDAREFMLKYQNPMFRDDVKQKMSGENHWSKREGNIHNWITNNPMHNPDITKKMSGDNHWSKKPGKIHNAKINHPKGSSKKISVDGVMFNSIKDASQHLNMDVRKIKKDRKIHMKKVSDVFKSIRFAKGEPRGKKHLSTDDEEHGTVGEMDFDQQLAHAKKRAMQEDLRNWFNPNHPEGDWKRINSKGEVAGDCAREPGEPKPKCMSKELRNSLTKKERASAVRRKRAEDPNAERQGAPINVANKVNEDMEQLDEKNKPTNPELWSRAIAQAKSKFDVYPSAYANGWASKWYKSKGGGWKTVSEAKEKSEYDYEGDMARGQLQSIINNAQRVHDMLEDNDNLPEWVQSKITLAEDYISTVSNYMMSEVDEEVVVEGKGLWANIRAKRERIKNGSGERMRKPGSKGAPSEEILKKTQALKEEEIDEASSPAQQAAIAIAMKKAGKKPMHETLEEGRPSQRHPLEGHEYHKKTDAELVHIAKDAHKAAEAMKSHNTDAENKYRDQANDSATVRYYRQKHGMADWYKKKYGHIKEEVVEEGAKSPGVGWMLKADPKLGEKVKAKKEKYKEFKQNVGKKTTPMKEEVVDEALSPAIRMQMALKKAREDRERSERNGEAALAGKFSGPAKQPMKNPTLVSPKNEEVIVEDNVINKEPKLPFDEPTTKAKPPVKDKSGAVHTPMSRTRDIARMAARRQAGIKEAADVNDPLDKIDTQAKRSLSKTAGIVKDLATNAKSKAKSKDKKDAFEPEPELSSQIMKQE